MASVCVGGDGRDDQAVTDGSLEPRWRRVWVSFCLPWVWFFFIFIAFDRSFLDSEKQPFISFMVIARKNKTESPNFSGQTIYSISFQLCRREIWAIFVDQLSSDPFWYEEPVQRWTDPGSTPDSVAIKEFDAHRSGEFFCSISTFPGELQPRQCDNEMRLILSCTDLEYLPTA